MADTDKSLYSLRYNQVTSNLEAFGGGSPQWTNITLNNVDPTQVPVTRLISTTAPLQGGGNLTADRTLSIPQANGTTDGFLSSTDWLFFTAKLTSILNSANIFVGNGSNVAVGVSLSGDASLSNAGALTFNTVNGNVGTFTNAQITVNAKGLITAASSGTIGSLTDVGTDGIIITGGTNAVLGTGTSIAQHVADTTHNGYLSSTDWTTFNAKQDAGNYITALTGDVTATGPGSVAATLATVNGNVGSFTNASITVNAKGLITAASSGTAPVTSVSGTAGDISSTGGTTPVLDLVNTAVTPATYTNATVTVDQKGRITSASSGTAPVTSVSGTTNQIDSTGGTTPVLSLSSTLQLPGTLQLGGDENANSHKITNLTSGSASGDALAWGQAFTSGTITFSPTTSGIKGTTTNDSTTAGNVGEYIESLASGGTNFPTSNNWGDLTSISLTAGDWDVTFTGEADKSSATEAQFTNAQIGISQTSGNSSTGLVDGNNLMQFRFSNGMTTVSMTVASYRQSLSTTTTIYAKMRATYSGGQPILFGRLSARRIR